MKKGLNRGRLSSHRFLANAQKLMVHVLAYLLYSLFREANARTPELKTMEVGTARFRLFEAGALLKASHRRIWLHVASHWPGLHLLPQAIHAVAQYTQTLVNLWRTAHLFIQDERTKTRADNC